MLIEPLLLHFSSGSTEQSIQLFVLFLEPIVFQDEVTVTIDHTFP
jgi:hypothetical protein